MPNKAIVNNLGIFMELSEKPYALLEDIPSGYRIYVQDAEGKMGKAQTQVHLGVTLVYPDPSFAGNRPFVICITKSPSSQITL